MARRGGTLRFVRGLVAMNLRSSFALRGAFWLQAAFMLLNNLFFFTVWWILFTRFQEIGGWRLDDMMTLYGIAASGYGLCVVLVGGVRELARAIHNGDLDPLLVQPKPVLLHQIGSRTFASGWGDIATGVAMLVLAGRFDLAHLPAIALAVVASASVFSGAAILTQSLAFWLGNVDALARQLWEFTLAFSLYPPPLFTGAVSFLLYTLLPAAFVSFLPAELVRTPSPGIALAVAAGAFGWLGLGLGVFHLGLRRYESGNQFGARV